jgi:probable regulatory domain-containing protein
MSEEVPLKPVGKEDVRRLELALLLGTLLRPDVLEKVRSSEDRLTWLDSLLIAAGALARDRAGYSASKIAEELGRTEATVRNHLAGKTEAGKLVKETYEEIKSKGSLEIPIPTLGPQKELEDRLKDYEAKLSELRSKLDDLQKIVDDMRKLLGI